MARAKTNKRRTPTARTNKAGANKAGAAKAGAAKAGAAKAGAAKAGAAKAGTAKAGTAKAGATKAGATKAGAAKPGTNKPLGKKSAAAVLKPAKPQSRKTPGAASSRANPASATTRAAKLQAIREAAAVPPAATGSDSSEEDRRNFGLRGAAPWVARHAAKHAEELRRRNLEPPPPGSARATLRTPKEAEQIKSRIAQLYQLTGQINGLRKKLDKSFFEIGELLSKVQLEGLFEAKGYSTLESFIDRELELPRATALKLIRLVHTFDRDAALDYPLDRLLVALSALDGEAVQPAPSQAQVSSRTFSPPGLPPKPPLRWD